MLENSVDAGATSIDVVVKDGGLKLLQITDNGSGINVSIFKFLSLSVTFLTSRFSQKVDLGLLCERFTTSKLSKFEDLSTIATYGFRGEALASISHISHLTVTTKTAASACAWRQMYLDGKPVDGAPPTAVAGRTGTQVLVEDLFYNTPSRLRTIKSPADEYGKVLDVVGRYACHCAGVAFTCKKAGDAYPALNVPAASSRRDRVRAVYGSAVATELIEVTVPASEKHGLRRADALVTNPNYSAKRSTPPVLFINGRSVACDPLRKALTGVYTIHLPRGGHYFAYLSLEIDPRNLDVNVHPTKREVRFLYEDEIIEHVCAAVQEALAACGASRTFQTQTVLPGARASAVLKNSTAALGQSQAFSQKRPYEYNLVRTDSKQAKLTTLFSSSHTPVPHSQCTHHDEEDHQSQASGIPIASSSSGNTDGSSRPNSSGGGSMLPLPSQYRYIESRRDRVDVRLKSIAQLREAIATAAHEPLTRVLADHTYIGVVDHARRLAAFQHGVRMFVVDYGVLCQEYFYQVGVADFGNFGTLTLGEAGSGVGMQALLNVLEHDEAVSNEERAVLETVWGMREMLHEYFSITLARPSEVDAANADPNEIQLVTLPMLVKGWVPALHKLPYFVRDLVSAVNWEDEHDCLEGVLRALSKLYAPEPVADSGEPGGATAAATSSEMDIDKDDDVDVDVDDDAYDARRRAEIEEALERLLFPAIQRRLLAPRWLADHVVEIANLPGLYKVFERC